MEEKLIEFETAQLAQEKGFSENVDFCYDSEEKNIEDPYVYNVGDLSGDDELYAPTQSLLQTWLREVHNIFVFVDFESYSPDIPKYYAGVKSLSSKNMGELLLDGFSLFKTYEEALEEGLYNALKLI